MGTAVGRAMLLFSLRRSRQLATAAARTGNDLATGGTASLLMTRCRLSVGSGAG